MKSAKLGQNSQMELMQGLALIINSRKSLFVGLCLALLVPASAAWGQPVNTQSAGNESLAAPAQHQPDNMSSQPADFLPVLTLVNSLNPPGWVAQELVVSQLPLKTMLYGMYGPIGDPMTASLLNEFRCTTIVSRAFQRGQRLVQLRVYRFDSSAGAYGAYSTMRVGASTVVTRGDASSEDDQSISFWKDNYFIRLTTTSMDDEESKEMLRDLADQLAVAISGHAGMPGIIARLPNLDRIAGSERLIMGPVMARHVTPLPLVGLLSLEKAQEAASADYHFGQPHPERMKLLLINYGNEPLASSVYRFYTETLGQSHKGDVSVTSSIFKVTDSYIYCRLRGNQLAIISGARNRFSPLILARQLFYQ